MKLLNFKLTEVACKCGCGFGLRLSDVDLELLNVLEIIRDHIRKNYLPSAVVIINSCCRCPSHNMKVGGEKQSYHLYGMAADIRVPGITPYQLYGILNMLFPDKYGMKRYNTFVHIDVRPIRVRF